MIIKCHFNYCFVSLLVLDQLDPIPWSSSRYVLPSEWMSKCDAWGLFDYQTEYWAILGLHHCCIYNFCYVWIFMNVLFSMPVVSDWQPRNNTVIAVHDNCHVCHVLVCKCKDVKIFRGLTLVLKAVHLQKLPNNCYWVSVVMQISQYHHLCTAKHKVGMKTS